LELWGWTIKEGEETNDAMKLAYCRLHDGLYDCLVSHASSISSHDILAICYHSSLCHSL
jgi:hypothetical protein